LGEYFSGTIWWSIAGSGVGYRVPDKGYDETGVQTKLAALFSSDASAGSRN
jgi:hypothetical protein